MNAPNKITLVRILLIPVFLAIFFLHEFIPSARLIAAIIFTIASVTDFLDGYLARKYKIVTVLGIFLDTIADKMLVTSALIALVFNQAEPFTLWIVIMTLINIFRDFIITGLRTVAAAKNVIISADKFGKLKANFQMISLPILLASFDLDELVTKPVFLITGFVLLAIATVLSILSGFNYVLKNKGVFKEDKKEQ